MDNRQGEPSKKDESASKQKVVTLEVKFRSNVNRVIGEIADRRDVDMDMVQGTLDIQSEALGEDKLINADEDSSCEGRCPRSDARGKLHI